MRHRDSQPGRRRVELDGGELGGETGHARSAIPEGFARAGEQLGGLLRASVEGEQLHLGPRLALPRKRAVFGSELIQVGGQPLAGRHLPSSNGDHCGDRE